MDQPTALAALITDAFLRSIDLATGEYDKETSGIKLIRSIKRYGELFNEHVFCAMMSPAYDMPGRFSGYEDLIDESIADAYIPRKDARKILAALVKSNFKHKPNEIWR